MGEELTSHGTNDNPIELETRLLSPTEVAERLSISRSSVYGLIDAGRLQRVHIGRSVRISLRSVHEFVQSLNADQSSPTA